jgi:glycosyltransferase involved in cell wall biosynthesis
MRIAYIHQYYLTPEVWGGTRSYEFARRLAQRGHEVHILTTDLESAGRSRRWHVTIEQGVHVHRLPVAYSNHMSYGRRLVAFAAFALAVSARATQVAPDLVFATSTPLTVAIPGIVASRLRRKPFVFEVRDLWPEIPIDIGALKNPVTKRLAQWLARLAYNAADQVVALSPGMAAGVIAQGYPADRVTVVPNSCDLELFAVPEAEVTRFRGSLPWLQGRSLVLYAGSVGLANGVDYLVHLAAAVRPLDPEIRFAVVGDGGQAECVRQLAAQLHVLDETFFMLPLVPKSQIPVVVASADIATSLFIPLPSLEHNSANKFFDALAAARPVAINYGGWQADLLERSGAGLVLDPRSPDVAAGWLVKRVQDPDWLAQAGQAAGVLAREEFSRDMLFERFERVLLRAATGEGTPRVPR